MAQINARNKGHQFELYVRNVFRALGYMQCKTSRSCNRELDAAGVDLLRQTLIYEPSGRITAKTSMDHEYFNGLDKSAV